MSISGTAWGMVPRATWNGTDGYRSSSGLDTFRYQPASDATCASLTGLTCTEVSNRPAPDGGDWTDMFPAASTCLADEPSAVVMVTSLMMVESSDDGKNAWSTCMAA